MNDSETIFERDALSGTPLEPGDAVYISGPMSGIPKYNFPKFKAAAEDLRWKGLYVLSPVEMDEAEGLDPAGYKDGDLPEEKYADVLSRDITAIAKGIGPGFSGEPAEIKAIVLLPGWESSGGARTELAYCRATGRHALTFPELEPIPATASDAAIAEANRSGEVRIVDPATGGAKGQKDARMDLIPPEELTELSRVYGFGASKYSDVNYLLGYNWRLSYGALLRHLQEWNAGRDLDEETGRHHLAHAAWHCFTLMLFQREGLGTDDRLVTWLQKPEDERRAAAEVE